MADYGHEVAVFAIDSDPTVSPIPGVDVRIFPPTPLKYTLSEELKQAFISWQPDIVHLHSSYNIASAGVAHWLQRQGIPYTITTHGNLNKHLLRRRWYVKFPYKHLIQLPYFNKAHFIHAVGDTDDAHDYGVTVPVETVPNGVEVCQHNKVAETAFYARFPQLKDKRIFLFVGRLDPYQKGLEHTIRGFAAADLLNSVLVLVGPDFKGSRDELTALVEELGMTDRILFAGPLFDDNKLSAFKAADVFVHTSLWEGHAFSILEAMANGLPCLVTAGADPQGTIKDGLSGVSVDDFTLEAITEGFRKIGAADEGTLREMGQHARRVVDEDYNWRDITRRLLNIYHKYIESSQTTLQPVPESLVNGG
jgi:glycosyltransferase involved in cell wall biosynthesis